MPRQLLIPGQVSIEPCEAVAINHRGILIMGPTGAGKSTFIEALAGEGQSLGISKNQLAGFTQDVTPYTLQNAHYVSSPDDKDPWPVCLIDTPGFSDSKISELEIINKIKIWMRGQGIDYLSSIIYLSPITDTRLSGTKRRTIKMMQSVLRDDSARRVTIVTTMWDTVSNPQASERAEANFIQLRDDIWKDLVEGGAHVARFLNNHASAIEIVKHSIEAAGKWPPFGDAQITVADRSAPLLYQELLDRINVARQEIESLRHDEIEFISNPDPLLESVVLPRLHEVKHDLAKFQAQLVEFGTPPPGYEGIPERVIYQRLLDCVNEAKENVRAIKAVLGGMHRKSADKTRKAILKARLKAAKADFAAFALTLIKQDNPPDGYERVIFAYRDLTIEGCIAQARRAARDGYWDI